MLSIYNSITCDMITSGGEVCQMTVYWCDITRQLAKPEGFLRWCASCRIMPETYLCLADAMRHFAGEALQRLARQDGTPHTSVSHSGALVLCACADHPVGIDAEELAPVPSIPPRFFTSAETAWMHAQRDPVRAFYRLWTRKESLIKVNRSVLADMLVLPELVENGALRTRVGTLTLSEPMILPDRFCVSLCCEGSGNAELIHIPAETLFAH